MTIIHNKIFKSDLDYGRGPILFNCLHCGLKGHGYARCFKATDEDKKKIRDQQQIKYKALNSQVAGKLSQ